MFDSQNPLHVSNSNSELVEPSWSRFGSLVFSAPANAQTASSVRATDVVMPPKSGATTFTVDRSRAYDAGHNRSTMNAGPDPPAMPASSLKLI